MGRSAGLFLRGCSLFGLFLKMQPLQSTLARQCEMGVKISRIFVNVS